MNTLTIKKDLHLYLHQMNVLMVGIKSYVGNGEARWGRFGCESNYDSYIIYRGYWIVNSMGRFVGMKWQNILLLKKRLIIYILIYLNSPK